MLSTGHRIAIVSDIENTTRDIIEYHVDDEERQISYIVADSGGIIWERTMRRFSRIHYIREREMQ